MCSSDLICKLILRIYGIVGIRDSVFISCPFPAWHTATAYFEFYFGARRVPVPSASLALSHCIATAIAVTFCFLFLTATTRREAGKRAGRKMFCHLSSSLVSSSRVVLESNPFRRRVRLSPMHCSHSAMAVMND